MRQSHRSMWFVVLVGLGAALVSALLVGGAHSASQQEGLIAFTRHDGIYVMRPDGGGVGPLRRGGVAASAFGLAWSPDGRKLAFGSNKAGETGLWVMSANGTGLVRLAFPGKIKPFSAPTWSPDGRRIAFSASGDGGGLNIWVMNANGSDLRQLTRTPGLQENEVDWSPAGGRIAFTTGGYVPVLYVMNANGGNLRKLSVLNPPRTIIALEPRWSPDGRSIAFVFWKNSHLEDEIYVTAAGGRSLVQLTSNTVMDYHPAWSPDGSRIAFLRSDEEECWFKCRTEKRASSEIYVMNADGSGGTRLTYNQLGEGNPAWQPVAAR